MFLVTKNFICEPESSFDATILIVIRRRHSMEQIRKGMLVGPLTGVEVFDQVKTIFGKKAGDGGKGHWKKESIM